MGKSCLLLLLERLMNILGEVRKVIPVGANGAALAGIPTSSRQYTVVTNTIVTSDGTAITVSEGQIAFVQNWDDAAVYVRCGAGASSSNATYLLSAGTAANDGTGGSVLIDNFMGTLSFAAATGSPRVNVSVFS